MLKFKSSLAVLVLCSSFEYSLLAENKIDWEVYLSSQIEAETLDKLTSGKLQEAEWLFKEKKEFSKARAVNGVLESILRYGKILKKDVLGGGASETLKLSLPEQIEAVFKPKSLHPSSNYRSEIAAYKIDQILSFNLVPMTVERQVDGVKGSLQFFVKDSMTVKHFPQYKKSARLNLFDYIIFNKDRHNGNVLIVDSFEIAIDHGLSLRKWGPLGGFLHAADKTRNWMGRSKHPLREKWLHPKTNFEEFLISKERAQFLRKIEYKKLKRPLATLLKEDKIERVYHKLQKFLNLYDKHVQP